ncbi:hypothetical protein [Ktedonobacter robiniae]|uniref:hypothetical protein n=1 Tax=Ktedonobacter robiniae TaxID=2778365 RepID=UPI0019160D2F|nr:hypothetical protein [Ktedonobacter robiniae]
MEAQHTLHVVPVALLEQVQQVFGFPQDRRCLNGQEFLVHWLRVARIEQIPLLPHEPPQPVAVLTIQSLRAFCTSLSPAWPWCYDSTAKYLSVLQAAGLLLKVKQPKGMGTRYYFPLTSTPCLPVCVEQVQQLAGRRKSVRRSRALQRASACMETSGPEDTHDGKEAGDVKSRPVHLRLVPPLQQGQHDHGTRDRSSQMTQRHGDSSDKEEQVWRTVERLAAMMQSFGMRLTPAVRASMSVIVWEEFTRPVQSVSSQSSDETEPVSSPPRTQMNTRNDGMLNDRIPMTRKRRCSRRRSRGVEEERQPQCDESTPEGKRRPQPDTSTRRENGGCAEKTSTLAEERRASPESSTFETNCRPIVSTSVVEEDGQPQPKPSTSVQECRPLAQETVDLRGAQTQTRETPTHTRARACAEFNHLNYHLSLKKK